MKSTLSVIVPLFNEEENVKPLVKSIINAVGANPNFLEIVLVDDGSRDTSVSIALELAAQDKRVRLVRHECNQGLGAAIRTGIDAAEGDFVLYTDADLPFDFSLMPQLFSLADENAVVAGYRLNRGEGGRRWILTKAYNFLIWLLFGLYIQDVNFACKIFPKRFLQKVKFNSNGSFIDVEILLEARRCGLNIIEHPLVYYPRERGLSTLSRPGVILYILKEMLGYTAQLSSNRISFFGFANVSPMAKLTVYLTTALISMILFLPDIRVYQAVALWIFPVIGTGAVSLLLGWRTGLMAAIIAVVAAQLSLFWQNQTLFSLQIYLFLICATLGVIFSQMIYPSWNFVQKSLKLNTSE